MTGVFFAARRFGIIQRLASGCLSTSCEAPIVPVFFLVGNTTIKMERRKSDVRIFPLATAASEVASALAGLTGETAVAASVNPAAESLLTEACRRAGLRAPLFAKRDFPLGVVLAVDNPDVVGVDRIRNVKAAYARAKKAVAAVDLGTAVSISVADDGGCFVGGAILPGAGLGLRALAENTAFLPPVAFEAPESPLGRDTASAMRSGVFYGTLGAVREIVARIGLVLDRDLAVFLTGGDAALLASAAPKDWIVVPALTLEGLRLAYDERGS